MINFRPVSVDDISQIHSWFNEKHIQSFYSLREWTEKEVLEKLTPVIEGKKPLFGFIAMVNNEPIGYLQYCRVKEFPWPNQDFEFEIANEAAGLDFFIGNPLLIGKGLGYQIINNFLDQIIWPNFQFCIVDPDVGNIASIKLFEKCSFKRHKEIDTKDTLGKPVRLLLMIKSKV